MDVLDIVKKEPEKFIESADVLVVAGRGIKKEEDLAMIRKLAELLDGQVACTRPLAEAGWVEAKCQVGLSGRTVRPETDHYLWCIRSHSVCSWNGSL